MYVKLKTTKQVSVNGKPTFFQAGDWVEIGKQTALRWIADGEAYTPQYGTALRDGLLPIGCGAVVRNGAIPDWLTESLETTTQPPHLLYYFKNLLWDATLSFRQTLLLPGFDLLNTWEVVVPFVDYDTLAIHIGNEADRKRTAGFIRDLRVPVYEPRLLFIKRSPRTIELINHWQSEMAQVEGGDERLAFMRALYRVKPLVLAVPYMWGTRDGKDRFDR